MIRLIFTSVYVFFGLFNCMCHLTSARPQRCWLSSQLLVYMNSILHSICLHQGNPQCTLAVLLPCSEQCRSRRDGTARCLHGAVSAEAKCRLQCCLETPADEMKLNSNIYNRNRWESGKWPIVFLNCNNNLHDLLKHGLCLWNVNCLHSYSHMSVCTVAVYFACLHSFVKFQLPPILFA